jgi:hypothetical protein
MLPIYRNWDRTGGKDICTRNQNRIQNRIKNPGLYPNIQERYQLDLDRLATNTKSAVESTWEQCCRDIEIGLYILFRDEAATNPDSECSKGPKTAIEAAENTFNVAWAEMKAAMEK